MSTGHRRAVSLCVPKRSVSISRDRKTNILSNPVHQNLKRFLDEFYVPDNQGRVLARDLVTPYHQWLDQHHLPHLPNDASQLSKAIDAINSASGTCVEFSLDRNIRVYHLRPKATPSVIQLPTASLGLSQPPSTASVNHEVLQQFEMQRQLDESRQRELKLQRELDAARRELAEDRAKVTSVISNQPRGRRPQSPTVSNVSSPSQNSENRSSSVVRSSSVIRSSNGIPSSIQSDHDSSIASSLSVVTSPAHIIRGSRVVQSRSVSRRPSSSMDLLSIVMGIQQTHVPVSHRRMSIQGRSRSISRPPNEIHIDNLDNLREYLQSQCQSDDTGHVLAKDIMTSFNLWQQSLNRPLYTGDTATFSKYLSKCGIDSDKLGPHKCFRIRLQSCHGMTSTQ
jgi:hypothetical protein